MRSARSWIGIGRATPFLESSTSASPTRCLQATRPRRTRPSRPGTSSRSPPERLATIHRLRIVFDLIDHVGVAVSDLGRVTALYEGTFGMPVVHRETVKSQGVEAVLLDVGD